MRNGEVKKLKQYLSIALMTVVLLTVTVVISIIVTDNVFARNDRYASDSSQAATVSNSCLNPIFDSSTIDNAIGIANCGSTISQQHESGQASAPITNQIENPTIEVQRASTTSQPVIGTPPTAAACERCFNVLTAIQSAFEDDLSRRIPGITTIEQLCALLQNEFNSIEDPTETLEAVDDSLNLLAETGVITESISSNISSCLRSLYG